MSEYDTFRRRKASDLSRFATALRNSRLSCDVGGFNSASADCQSNPPNGSDSWGYSLSGVRLIDPAEQKHVRPSGATLSELVLNVVLEGKCVPTNQRKQDPLTRLGVEIKILGVNAEGQKIRSSWYMDRHSAASPMKTPVHPTYHFQFGGIQSKQAETGNMIVASAPRVAHPPLDAVLAIDFALSNFFHEEWIELRTDKGQYYSVVKDTQRWLWMPYVKASDKGWDRVGLQHPWQVVEVWPQLIPEEGLGPLHD